MDALHSSSESDESEEEIGIQINTKFAKEYSERKRAEELTKYRENNGYRENSDPGESKIIPKIQKY